MVSEKGDTQATSIKVGAIKLQLTPGKVHFIRFGYPDAQASSPSWFWSSTAGGKQALELISKYGLSQVHDGVSEKLIETLGGVE